MQQKFFSLMEGLVRIPSNKRRVSRAVGALATEDRAVSSPSAVWSAAESRTDARLWVQWCRNKSVYRDQVVAGGARETAVRTETGPRWSLCPQRAGPETALYCVCVTRGSQFGLTECPGFLYAAQKKKVDLRRDRGSEKCFDEKLYWWKLIFC